MLRCAHRIADAGARCPGSSPFSAAAYSPACVRFVLPISISGLGVREGLFVLFLHPLGVPRSQAIALGLLLYLLNLVVSLAGAPSFAIGHKSKVAAA